MASGAKAQVFGKHRSIFKVCKRRLVRLGDVVRRVRGCLGLLRLFCSFYILYYTFRNVSKAILLINISGKHFGTDEVLISVAIKMHMVS